MIKRSRCLWCSNQDQSGSRLLTPPTLSERTPKHKGLLSFRSRPILFHWKLHIALVAETVNLNSPLIHLNSFELSTLSIHCHILYHFLNKKYIKFCCVKLHTKLTSCRRVATSAAKVECLSRMSVKQDSSRFSWIISHFRWRLVHTRHYTAIMHDILVAL